MKKNIIFKGNCKYILKDKIEKDSVDLLYIDPPFYHDSNTKESFETYINSIKDIVREGYCALKENGSIFINCDVYINSKTRVFLDNLFGEENFRNEIIWEYQKFMPFGNNFPKVHSTIYWYSKSNKYTFNKQYKEYSQEEISRIFNKVDDGGRYSLHTAQHISDNMIRKCEEEGRLVRNENGKILIKKYLEDSKGTIINDVWTDISLTIKRNKNFPSQQPEVLLERIIKTSTNPGDLVLDPMCGSGTTLVASEKLNRNWIGIDINPEACRLSLERLKEINNNITDKSIIKKGGY
jgi:DNA modification methylase